MTTLTLTQRQFDDLRQHLYPGDGKEAVAFLLCGRRKGRYRHRLLVRQIVKLPHEVCHVRRPNRIEWPTDQLPELLDIADRNDWSVVKVHSHPTGVHTFSRLDDLADKRLFSSLPAWITADVPHCSMIMLPDGRLLGRTVDEDGTFSPMEAISIVGHDVSIYYADHDGAVSQETFVNRHALAFGQDTTTMLRRLSVAVVGCSGTGSPLIEQLHRLGIGRLVIVDPDTVEEANLNRILHSTRRDIGRPKAEVLGDAVDRAELGTEVVRICEHVTNREVIHAVAECDFVFGCMDEAGGRSVLNRLAAFYILPYIDVGIGLSVDGDGNLTEATAAVHYLQPGLSTLETRGVIKQGRLSADLMRRINPDRYMSLRRDKYIHGADEPHPAVISVNMMAAAMAVNDFLARLHSYRTDGNQAIAQWRISLMHVNCFCEPDAETRSSLDQHVGRGDVEPCLDMPQLSRRSTSQGNGDE